MCLTQSHDEKCHLANNTLIVSWTIPFDIIAIMACLYPEQFVALFGAGSERARFGLHYRHVISQEFSAEPRYLLLVLILRNFGVAGVPGRRG
jgi:hypothetical protein